MTECSFYHWGCVWNQQLNLETQNLHFLGVSNFWFHKTYYFHPKQSHVSYGTPIWLPILPLKLRCLVKIIKAWSKCSKPIAKIHSRWGDFEHNCLVSTLVPKNYSHPIALSLTVTRYSANTWFQPEKQRKYVGVQNDPKSGWLWTLTISKKSPCSFCEFYWKIC